MAQSKLATLKESLGEFGRMTTRSAEGMDEILTHYERLSDEILGLIAGSSQARDTQIVEAIQQASGAVKRAQESLRGAARIANEYAAQL